MRTAIEIKRWMESHKWYKSFKLQTWITFMPNRPFVMKILSGELGRDSISVAFDWSRSYEGFQFWSDIDIQFIKWYEKEGK